MRLLIPTFSPPTGTWSSLTRVLAVGDAARNAGHEVAYCAAGHAAERLAQLGFRIYPAPQSTMLGLPEPLSRMIASRSQEHTIPLKPGRSFGNIWLGLLLTGMASVSYLRKLVQAQMQAVRAFEPDMLFSELDTRAFLVSRITRVPLATTYASILKSGVGTFPWRRFTHAIQKVLQTYGKPGLQPQEIFGDPKVLKIIPSVPEFEEPLPRADDFVFTGSLLRSVKTPGDGVFESEPGRRHVFVYVGTGSIPLVKLRQVLPRVFPSGCATLCLVGAQGVPGEQRTGNVIWRPFFDAESIRPFATG